MTSFAWGYYLTEVGGNTVYHVDIYTKETIYRAKRGKVGWEVVTISNPIGKIPVLLFEQNPEAADVQPMIDRVEMMESVDADVNDRFANPAMVATAEILNSLPKAEEEAKLFILKNGGEVKYLTWDQASQSKTNQFERLDKHILSKSFTPNIDFDNMKSLGNLSAKAIRKVMLLAVIKADKHKEKHDDYMNRHASLMKAIMANVLDYTHKAEHDALVVSHSFQEPFGDDVSEMLADLSKQFNDGALSRETYIELSYLVKDAKTEIERLKAEEAAAMERQMEMNKMDVSVTLNDMEIRTKFDVGDKCWAIKNDEPKRFRVIAIHFSDLRSRSTPAITYDMMVDSDNDCLTGKEIKGEWEFKIFHTRMEAVLSLLTDEERSKIEFKSAM